MPSTVLLAPGSAISSPRQCRVAHCAARGSFSILLFRRSNQRLAKEVSMAAKSAQFKPVIKNNPALSLGLYPKIKPPSSTITSAPSPTFVSSPEMKALLKSDSHASLSHVWGLTVGTFSLHFADALKQWTKNSDGRWQFQGGDVELVVVNRIYIDKDMMGTEARLDSDVTGLIMTHELLHVQDNVEVMTKNGPEELSSDRVIRSLLIDAGKGEPAIVEEREYNHWVND